MWKKKKKKKENAKHKTPDADNSYLNAHKVPFFI